MNDQLFDGPSNLFEGNVEPAKAEPQALPRKKNMGNDKDRMEAFREMRAQTIKSLYQNDPLVRQSINAQLASDDAKPKAAPTVVQYDEAGSVSGVSPSVMRGSHATTKNQTDLIKAIRADINKYHGIG